MSEQTANKAGNARAAAIARRQALSRGGAKAVGQNGNGARSSNASAPSANNALAGLTGNELARARRAMLAQGGKKGSAAGAPAPSRPAPQPPAGAAAPKPQPAPSRPAPPPAAAAAPKPQPANRATPSMDKSNGALAGLSGNELARARRAMLSQGGQKGSAAGTVAPSRPAHPAPVVVVDPHPDAEGHFTPLALGPSDAELETLCDVAESNPEALGPQGGSVRQLCRERRRALASQGKTAVRNGKGQSRPNGGGRRGGSYIPAEIKGRELARQHRRECCNGRGQTPPARPSGRVRPNGNDAPQKVEVGETLAGSAVTGTQVERTSRVTGNEPGTCRTITGTEYIGADQFQAFCGARPAPNPTKVGASVTTRGMVVTGPEIGRSSRVTGDEMGSCKTVTGTEYLGSERFEEFCETRSLAPRPAKVVAGATERKGLTVTGVDEARGNSVTGAEAGSKRSVTGSQYSDPGVARLTINGPAKVALTHTYAGTPVSGTAVGRSTKVTGDEHGACSRVSGDQYLSTEQFVSVCNTKPEPATETQQVSATAKGKPITGDLVERTEKVTGNEPGSCQRVTGSQYGQATLCGGGPQKVVPMQTLAGQSLTGTAIARGPKLTGDELGGCVPVTGDEYYGREQYEPFCPSTPVGQPAKVGVSQSNRGLPVSGTMVGRTNRVTGNEYGAERTLSGTPYANREQVNGPNATGFQAGGGRSGPMTPRSSRFLPASQQLAACPPSAQPLTPAPQDFSVAPPARVAQEARSRITGTAYGGAGRITGPVNMAVGLVSGTPEFRYSEDNTTHGGRPAPAQCVITPTAAPQPENAEAVSRVTGEGGEGIRITGDNWSRSDLVTGTEGRWAQTRNPTLRGETQGMAPGAFCNKGRERPDVPVARVTGSSGNTGNGALITVSGGARG